MFQSLLTHPRKSFPFSFPKQEVAEREVNGVQAVKKRTTQLGASVMPSGAAMHAKGAADSIRPATPDPLPSPEGHEDTNPNYDRVRFTRP